MDAIVGAFAELFLRALHCIRYVGYYIFLRLRWKCILRKLLQIQLTLVISNTNISNTDI